MPYRRCPAVPTRDRLTDGPLKVRSAPRSATGRMAWVGLLLIAGIAGCRGAAYREVYQQKMIRELRTLEDQLNEAEYNNEVLQEKLARSRNQVHIPSGSRGQAPGADRKLGTVERIDRPTPSTGPSGTPLSDPRGGAGDASEPQPTLPARPIDSPLGRDDIGNGRPRNGAGFQPPSVQFPPGRETTDYPDIDLGEPVPPAGRDATIERPPGQIELPEPTSLRGVDTPTPPAEPVGIRIDPSLSGGYRNEDLPGGTGMQVLIQAIDKHGDPVPIERFQIEGDLSVVLLDPLREPADARLGRWDFDEQQLRSMVRPGPYGGIQIYLDWQEKRPLGTHVLAHVKIGTQDVELRTEAELSTKEAVLADWNPRGTSTR
ncbi:MAG: hypothetical protein EA381_14220 [Planctomycetaceae bacterium]|nr:MAG: hypothetical protein EA381_14220 [Planctomycetaceae bacterium]